MGKYCAPKKEVIKKHLAQKDQVCLRARVLKVLKSVCGIGVLRVNNSVYVLKCT